MVFSNVIVDVTVPRRSSVFSQSSVQISAGLTDISGLAVAAFDLIIDLIYIKPFTILLRIMIIILMIIIHIGVNHRQDWPFSNLYPPVLRVIAQLFVSHV